MTRTPYAVTPVEVESSFASDPALWLVARAQQYGLRYLLAHADDGVIWGRIDGNSLRTSHGIAPASPPLRASTLQQARLFSPAGELLVWRVDSGWRARLVSDADGNADDVIDEDQLLWGDTVEATSNGFTLLREGSQGMRHAVPVTVTPDQIKRHELRLRVRHYITENDDGEARISLSRLVQVLP
ncbi:MAG: CRISPR-associated protein Csx19 [Roseiflexaceae bacterium]|nr:CRISPR-associated protein Csx19 [Roseiflexaceae bacterium]